MLIAMNPVVSAFDNTQLKGKAFLAETTSQAQLPATSAYTDDGLQDLYRLDRNSLNSPAPITLQAAEIELLNHWITNGYDE